MNFTEELQNVSGASYPEIYAQFRKLQQEYGSMPMSQIISAFNNITGRPFTFGNMNTPDPYVQNRRVKAIATRPANYTKNQVAEFLQNPDNSEKPLRAVMKALEYTSYPMYHTRRVYQDLLTYHSYIAPRFVDEEQTKNHAFWREWTLLEKLRSEICPKDKAHELTGRALQSGKVFVVPRVSVDKAHNSVNHAFLQRLPSDWTKIVGYNNISKYTVAFDLMYFAQYGTDWRQFGNLFEPYMGDFLGSLAPAPAIRGNKVVYASKTGLNLSAIRNLADDRVDAYYQNGRWFYWVTLPVDRVFPFEIDDTEDNVLPPFAGLFIDMIQLAQMEQIQLELLQNPLVSLLHGEIPYWDDRNAGNDDQYKLSNAGMMLFESLWYQMLQANNTSGIGLFMAPLENMKLESLTEVPGATEIVSQGYTDVMAQAGLTAIIPTTDEARAGAVQVSLLIESRAAQTIYVCFERMMNRIIERLGLNFEWHFKMFGDLATDKDREKSLKEEMTLGLLPSIIEFNAMHDRSLLDDITMSDAVIASKIMDKRLPLISSYNASNKDGNLPPQGGRPRSEGVTSDGAEQDVDSQAE